MNYGYKVTTDGRELLAALLATGKELKITRVAVGSGKVAENVNLADMNSGLIQYVADGKIAQRRHQNNILYLTVQYASNFTPGLGAFYLSEFVVEAEHPVSGESKVLLYATLGDYIQPVMAYSEIMAPDIRNYPIVLAISDEINVTIMTPAGLVTYEDLDSMILELMEKAAADGKYVNETDVNNLITKALEAYVPSGGTGGVGMTPIEFVIPVDAWVENPDATGQSDDYYADVANEEVSDLQYPIADVDKNSQTVAYDCGMDQTVDTYNGYLRFYSARVPEAEISGTCQLLTEGTAGGGTNDVPRASHTQAGIVLLGEEFDTDEDGRLIFTGDATVDPDQIASDAATESAVGDVFGM